VLESHHSADFEMPAGAWPFHKICRVAEGRGRLEVPEEATDIRRDDFLLVPAGLRHRFVDAPREPLTLVMLCLSTDLTRPESDPELARLWRRALELLPAAVPGCARTAFHHSGLLDLFRSALREQAEGRRGWGSALRALAAELVVRLARGHTVPRRDHRRSRMQAVDGAIEYVDGHPNEPLTIDDMAARCQLSGRRFTSLFKERTGMTFNQYLNRKRIEFACARLRETRHILYACHESGFNDPAYFYRVFKKQTGQTPGRFVAGLDRKS
jgi:AraC-like DNA-binding protein